MDHRRTLVERTRALRSALERMLLVAWLPWVLAPLFVVAFWILESLLHSAIFDHQGFVDQLLWPAPHEFWMRLVVAMLLLATAWLWSASANRRRVELQQRQAYQQQLAQLAATIAYGDSEQRRELARRLHEDLAQQLSAARMFLSTIELDAEDDRRSMWSAERILDRSSAACREIAEELAPPILDDGGILPALQILGSHIMRRSGTSIEIEGDDITLPRETLTQVFVAVSEVLELAATDPGTSLVRFIGSEFEHGVTMLIEWDAHSERDLFGVRERMAAVGGTVNRLHFGGGTSVAMVVPRHTPAAA